MSSLKLLIAIPNESLQTILCKILEEEGYTTLAVTSVDEALSAIQSHQIAGLIFTTDLIIVGENREKPEFLDNVNVKIPTVALITPDTWHLPETDLDWVIDTVHQPPLQEYVNLPLVVKELLRVLERVCTTYDA